MSDRNIGAELLANGIEREFWPQQIDDAYEAFVFSLLKANHVYTSTPGIYDGIARSIANQTLESDVKDAILAVLKLTRTW